MFASISQHVLLNIHKAKIVLHNFNSYLLFVACCSCCCSDLGRVYNIKYAHTIPFNIILSFFCAFYFFLFCRHASFWSHILSYDCVIHFKFFYSIVFFCMAPVLQLGICNICVVPNWCMGFCFILFFLWDKD